MKKLLSFSFALLLLPLSAQETKEDMTPTEELMKVMRMEDTVIEGGAAGFPMVEQSLAGQDLTKDEMTEVKDAFMIYMMKLAADPELKAKTIEVYHKSFTEEEIIELIAFYRSPIGQKALETLPSITGEVMLLSQKLDQRHVGIFQDALGEILARKAAREEKEEK